MLNSAGDFGDLAPPSAFSIRTLLRLVFGSLLICLMICFAFRCLVIHLHVGLAIRLKFSRPEILFAIRLIFGCPYICPYTRFKCRCLAIRFPIRPLMRFILRRLAMPPIIRLHPRLIFARFPARLMFRRMIAHRIFRLIVRLAALFRTSLNMSARLKRSLTYYTNHPIPFF